MSVLAIIPRHTCFVEASIQGVQGLSEMIILLFQQQQALDQLAMPRGLMCDYTSIKLEKREKEKNIGKGISTPLRVSTLEGSVLKEGDTASGQGHQTSNQDK